MAVIPVGPTESRDDSSICLLSPRRPLLAPGALFAGERVHVGGCVFVSLLCFRKNFFTPRPNLRSLRMPGGGGHIRRPAPTAGATARTDSHQRLGGSRPRGPDAARPG